MSAAPRVIQVDPDTGPPARHRHLKGFALTALLALAGTPSRAAAQDCLLPETFNPYFQAALDDIESTFETKVVGGLDDIGFGPIADLSINNLVDFKANVFEPLFGDAAERTAWIDVASDLDVKAQLESQLNAIIGDNVQLTMTCELETTDDLEEGELPYRFAMELVLSGDVLGADLNLGALSPQIAILPENTFDPLDLTIDTLTAHYVLKLPLTMDAKRRKFMVGEVTIDFSAMLSTSVSQSIPLTDTVSQNFAGNLLIDASLSYSSVKDWAYTASFETSLTAETSVGTSVANLRLIAVDDDLFDDKPRENIANCFA